MFLRQGFYRSWLPLQSLPLLHLQNQFRTDALVKEAATALVEVTAVIIVQVVASPAAKVRALAHVVAHVPRAVIKHVLAIVKVIVWAVVINHARADVRNPA